MTTVVAKVGVPQSLVVEVAVGGGGAVKANCGEKTIMDTMDKAMSRKHTHAEATLLRITRTSK